MSAEELKAKVTQGERKISDLESELEQATSEIGRLRWRWRFAQMNTTTKRLPFCCCALLWVVVCGGCVAVGLGSPCAQVSAHVLRCQPIRSVISPYAQVSAHMLSDQPICSGVSPSAQLSAVVAAAVVVVVVVMVVVQG